MRACARASRAPATIFMARVIFCVDLTLEIRLRMALSDGISESALHGDLELGVERLDGRVETLLQVVVEHSLLGDVGEERLVGGLDVKVELLLVALERVDRELVEV